MVSRVIGLSSGGVLRFGKKPEDMAHYQATMENTVYQVLGKKHLAHVVFEDSLPAARVECDRGMGSLASDGTKRLFKRLKSWGFNAVQQGPSGIQGFTPYESTRFALNPWYIPLKPLATPEWGNLLTPQDLEDVLSQNPNKGQDSIDRGFIYHSQKALLQKAYQTYQTKIENPSLYPADKKGLEQLQKAFTEFLSLNKSPNPSIPTELERNALFSAVAAEQHGELNPQHWPKGRQNLFRKAVLSPGALAQANLVKAAQPDAYLGDLFAQFLAKTFRGKGLSTAKDLGLQVFGDMSAVVCARDEWAYQHVFVPDKRLGIPEEPGLPDGGVWNGAVLNPDLLHDQKKPGLLGPAGQWLKQVVEAAFRHAPDGLRLDHFIGLIDPWVYPKGGSAHSQKGGARLFSMPGDGLNPKTKDLNRWAIPKPQQINSQVAPGDEARVMPTLDHGQVARYGVFLAIIGGVLKSLGKTWQNTVPEDLGTVTNPVKAVMKALDIPSMKVSMFRGDDDSAYHPSQYQPHDWVMFGTHDHETVWQVAQRDVETVKTNGPGANDVRKKVDQLGRFLFPLTTPQEAKDREAFVAQALTDVYTRVHGEYAALLASRAEHLQVTMSDYFGLRRFNDPQKDSPYNFTLRLTPDFEERYYERLQNRQALNLPEALLLALHARGEDKRQGALVIQLKALRDTLLE